MHKKLISALVMLCVGSYLFAADTQSDKMLAKRFKVHSLMFKNMLEDVAAEEPVKILQDMQDSDGMQDCMQSGILDIMRMAEDDSKEAVLHAYDNYLNGIEDQEKRAIKAAELLKAANFFDIKSIMKVSVERVAEHYGSQEIGAQFGKDPETFEANSWAPELNEMVVAKLLSQYKDQLTTSKLEQTFDGHDDWVSAVAYNPLGNQLAASGFSDNTIKLWNTETGACEQTLTGHTELVYAVAYNPSGNQLASGSDDNTIKLWNTETGVCTHTFVGHTDSVYAVAYHPSGNQLASGHDDTTIRLWNTDTGSCESTLAGHTHWVNAVAYSPSGNQLASGSKDGTIKLWNLKTGECEQTLIGYTKGVNAIAYHLSGDQLASGSDDGTIKLWNTKTGACERTLIGHTRWVFALAYHPSGNQLSSGSHDGTIKLWNTKTGKIEQILSGHIDAVSAVAYNPSGNQLASGFFDGTIRLWRIMSDSDYKQTVQLLDLMQALYVRQQLQKKEQSVQQNEEIVPVQQDQSCYFKELHDSLPDAIKRVLDKK